MTLTRLIPAAALALVAGVVPAQAAAPTSPQPGSDGIGDSYFPLDGNGGIDVLSYDIHDRYRFGSRKLSGHTTLQMRATQDLSSFNLDFLLPVSSATVDDMPATVDRPRRHEIRITPAAPLAEGQEVAVTVRYAGRPDRYTYAGESNWLATETEAVAMNEPHMAPWWFPANDHPSDKATIDVTITTDRDKRVISGGRRVSRQVHGRLATTHWSAKEPMATYLAFFAAGRYAVDHGVSRGLPWYVAASKDVPRRQRLAAMALLRKSPRIVRVLSDDLGPYPFGRTGGVAVGVPVGFALENQTRPTYPANGLYTDIVVHELAHQWFGDSVAVQRWSDIWLNEGAATFMELRWSETQHHGSAARWMRYQYDSHNPGSAFWSLELADPGAQEMFANGVYFRGAMTLQALRNRIGNRAFWRLIRAWLADHRGGNVTTADFEALAEQKSKQQLDGFFDAWLHSAARPDDTEANGLGRASKDAYFNRPAGARVLGPAGSDAH